MNRLLKRAAAHPLAPSAIIWRGLARSKGLQLRRNGPFFDLERDGLVLRIRASHAIYIRTMIYNFDHYASSVVPVRSADKHIVDMSGPRYHRLVGFGDVPFLFPSHTEPYETTREYLEFADLKEGEIVLDVGAYSGVTSIIFAQLVGTKGHVYAFEADETNYECAKVNVTMAAKVLGLNNITLVNKAMWSHNDGIVFSSEGAMGSSAVEITGGGRGQETLVPSTTLQSFLDEAGLRKVDFIKVDIEGGEVALLQTSAATMKNLGAKLIIEPHHINGKLDTQDCCALLKSAGYSVRVRDKVPGSEALIEAIPASHR